MEQRKGHFKGEDLALSWLGLGEDLVAPQATRPLDSGMTLALIMGSSQTMSAKTKTVCNVVQRPGDSCQ
jgi:hypothetical protein